MVRTVCDKDAKKVITGSSSDLHANKCVNSDSKAFS